MILFITSILIIGLYSHFRPEFDKTSNGDILLWYNHIGRREKGRKFLIIYKAL